MRRNLIAIALAAGLAPCAAFDAAAAPGAATQFGKTYKLYCAANGTNRIYVGNRTAPVIKAGTKLQIVLWTYKNGTYVKTVTAPREMTGIFGANYEFADTIRMCEASVTLPRDIGTMTKPAPWQKPLSPKAKVPGA